MSGPLADLRVVEWTATPAAAFAGFLLRELGAEVVKLESPGAPRLDGSPVLDRGKRAADAALWPKLAPGADAVLIDEGGPALPDDAGLVRCRVSAWGEAGPRRALPPDEALVAAATGMQSTQWSWAGRPVWLVTPIVSYMTGILAALGTVAATFARARGAGGQTVRVSGLQGALALQSGTFITGQGCSGSLLFFGDPRGSYPTYGLYPTADGWLLVGALTQPFWVKLAMLLERADLLADERLQGSPLSFGAPALRAFVRGELEPHFRAHTMAEWVARLRAADVPCGAVGTREGFVRDAEARTLGLVVDVEDPVRGATLQPAGPAAFSDTPLSPPRPARRPGTDTAALAAEAPRTRRPHGVGPPPRACLEGIRVIDFSSFIAGPFCPMLLADLGADVVKVESPDGDPFRIAAFAFVGWNRGKQSIVLDLKRPEGRAVFLDLARHADVVVDNVRVGVMDRLGIGWEQLRSVNPRLVHTSITGFGLTGPLAALPGFDPIFQARSGFMAAQGGDDDPVFYTIPYNDYAAGALAALATTAALLARERTGSGQRVDVSLFRTAFIDQAAEMLLPAPGKPARGGRDFLGPSAAERLYPCRDGWVCVAARSAVQREALGRLAGIGIGSGAPADGPAAGAIAAGLAARTREEALGWLGAAGVPAAPCVGADEVFTDAHFTANRGFVDVSDATLGRVTLGGPLVTFSETPIGYRGSAPGLGADAPAVLRGIGYDEARIEALMAAGVVGRP